MAVLLDTSILGRLADAGDPDHQTAQDAVDKLHARGETLHITAQNLIEFRNFATRPVGANGNGLGLSVADASKLMTDFEAIFPLLEETPGIYPTWRAIVDGLGIIGKTSTTLGWWPSAMSTASRRC